MDPISTRYSVDIDDVIESDRRMRISGQPPLHYLVADRSGHAATIEFRGGRLLVHTADRLPVSVLANDSYEESLAFWRGKKGRRAGGSGSQERFARAADALSAVKSGQPVSTERAFAVLRDVAQKSTRWSIVYGEPGAGREVVRRLQRDASCAARGD